MFWQRRKETRASRSCKVGQLGLEQLDARVVPSTLAPGAPTGNHDLKVWFDEYGHAFAKVDHGKTYQLDNEGGKNGPEKFKLPVTVTAGDVKVIEPKSKKDDSSDKDYNDKGKKENVSDLLRFVTKDRHKDEYNKDHSKGKEKQESWLYVYSDTEGDHEKGNKADVGIPEHLQDNTAKTPENKDGFVDYKAEGRKDYDAEYYFSSDQEMKKPWGT